MGKIAIFLVGFLSLSCGIGGAVGQSEVKSGNGPVAQADTQDNKPNQTGRNNERPRGFRLSKLAESLPADVKQVIAAFLAERFGTPAEPVVWSGLPVDLGEADKGNNKELGWKLRLGRDIYMAKCARCHGAGGDGSGPEADDLQPGPRDFRRGIFKWTSTKHGLLPLRHDLRETVRLGVPGTAMPAFPGFADEQVAALVEYVRWLTMSGQVERGMAIDVLDWQYSAKKLQSKLPEYTEQLPKSFSYFWLKAERESSIIRPKAGRIPYSDESIARGRELYLSKMATCSTCHGEDGRGRRLSQPDVWQQPMSATDLTKGIYRGGDGPKDLYRRIVGGINGTAMPKGDQRLRSNGRVWDLVNYLYSIRPPELRNKSVTPRRPPPAGLVDER